MRNLHNRYKLAERKISQKNPEYMLNYSLPCSCSKNLSSFWLILKQQWTIKISSPLFSIFSLAAILVGSLDHRTPFWKGAIQGSLYSSPDCHHCASVVRPSVNFSHFNQLLWSHWANLNQTFVEWSLDGPLPKMCPVIPTSNQDGCQAKNRKKGGWNFNCPLLL
jgi:hypothetical protein